MGELHLEIIVDIAEARVQGRGQCRRAAGGVSRDHQPQTSSIDYTHKKQTGGSGQFAPHQARVRAARPGSGFVFENEVVGGTVPKEFIPGVEKGLEASRDTGVLAGFPVIDFKATLIDGAYHDVDFERAGVRDRRPRGLPRRPCRRRGPKLLEPIMKVEVVTPEDYMGDVIGDLNSRRGQIHGMDSRGNAQVVNAMVPLANMFGYVNTLRSMTQGRAPYTMQFDHYEQVPQAVADEVDAKLAG